ncbi:MAG: TlpA family protein disulfide reductase [Armatimonadota bacterium]
MRTPASLALIPLVAAALVGAAPAQHHKPHGHGAHADRPAKAPQVKVGQRVPDFTVTDLSGAKLKLSELQKKSPTGVVSLTYWCSFCHSCRGVEKQLDQFAGQQREQAAVVLIDASAGETPERVSAFAEKTGLTLPILLDGGGKTVDLFGVHATTTTLVIDAKRVLRYRGQFRREQEEPAAAALEAVLGGKEVPLKETPQRG